MKSELLIRFTGLNLYTIRLSPGEKGTVEHIIYHCEGQDGLMLLQIGVEKPTSNSYTHH